MKTSFQEWTEADRNRALSSLERVLASPIFEKSERQKRFLHYVVTHTLEGHADQLKGYTIGLEVFDRSQNFDPAVDTIVRVEAMRLRAKLREYYDGEGRSEAVRFELPKGTYAVRILFRGQSRNGHDARGQMPTARMETGTDSAQVPDVAGGGRPWPIEDMPSLAVLPFANISPDPEQDYFADGITEDLITELSRISGMFVISRHSSFVYKGVSKRADEIGSELGVKYLLEGSVQRAGDRVRITAQLVDTTSGVHLWAEHYDRDLSDIFAVQDDVTQCIVAVLQVRLAGTEIDRLGHEGTGNMEAYDALLHGLERYWIYTQESTESARDYFMKAIELDPGYAMAHAWLARTLLLRWIFFWDPEDRILEQAYAHARMAVDLDDQLPYAHAVHCWVLIWRGQSEAAIAAGWKAVTLDPNNADACLFLTQALAASNRGEEALRLNPHPHTFYQLTLGVCYFVLERYELAIAALKRGVELSDVFIPNHYFLCVIYNLLDRKQEAHAEYLKLMSLTHGRKPVVRSIWTDEDLKARERELNRLSCLESDDV